MTLLRKNPEYLICENYKNCEFSCDLRYPHAFDCIARFIQLKYLRKDKVYCGRYSNTRVLEYRVKNETK